MDKITQDKNYPTYSALRRDCNTHMRQVIVLTEKIDLYHAELSKGNIPLTSFTNKPQNLTALQSQLAQARYFYEKACRDLYTFSQANKKFEKVIKKYLTKIGMYGII